MSDALLLIETCDTMGLAQTLRIATVDVNHDDYLDVRLASGPRAWLARTDVRARLERLATSLEKAKDLGKTIQFIDLTVDKNPPVQFTER
jgi:cell division septal protein FtsQ